MASRRRRQPSLPEGAAPPVAEEPPVGAKVEMPAPPADRVEQVARARAHFERVTTRRETDLLHPARALIEKNARAKE